MEKEKTVLIFDFGTSNVRAVLMLADSGEAVDKISIKNHWIQTGKGRSEMDAMSLWEHAQSAAETIVKRSCGQYEIIGIGFSFFGDSLIAADQEFTPLYPMIMAFDTRAQEEAAALEQNIGKENFRRITGGPCLSMLVCAKLLWLKNHEPEIFYKASYFLNIQEFILGKLGLGLCTDYTLANRKMMLDIRTKRWSKDLIQAVGIDGNQLGGCLCDSAYIAGYIKSFGRVRLPGVVPVVIGAHDSECGYLGLGANPEDKSILANVSGTYEMIGCFRKEGEYRTGNSLVETGCGLQKADMTESGSSIAGSYVTWFQKEICKKPDTMFDDMEKQILYDGNNPVFFLADNDRYNCVLEGFDTYTGSVRIYQAIIEGITYKMKQIVDEMERINGKPFQYMMCGGGGSSSDKWLQLKADLLNMDVKKVDNQEVSALGAGIITTVGVGYYEDFRQAIQKMVRVRQTFKPNPKLSELYQEKYREYKEKMELYKEELCGTL